MDKGITCERFAIRKRVRERAVIYQSACSKQVINYSALGYALLTDGIVLKAKCGSRGNSSVLETIMNWIMRPESAEVAAC